MSSLLVDWFLNFKVEATLDEVRRQRRTHLCLTDHEIQRLEIKTMRRIYNSRILHVFLNRNMLTLESIPRDFGFFGQNLISLTLAENKLTEIPSSIGLLKSLRVLNISWNPLTSHEFPVVLCELKNLRKLYANHTNIETLPEEVGQLEELKLLALRHNRIESIPPAVLKLRKLKWLTLSHNRIREVPFEIIEASALVHFNLNYNCVSVLPSNIWHEMQGLRYLYLKSNRLVLNTFMVKDLQKIPNLKKIDLSYNLKSLQENLLQFIVTPDTQFQVEIQEDVDVETEEIWRRDGGLSPESSHIGFLGGTTLSSLSQPESEIARVPQEVKPRRHSSAPTKIHLTATALKKHRESGNLSPSGCDYTQETDSTQCASNLQSSTSQFNVTNPAETGSKSDYNNSESCKARSTGIPNREVSSVPESKTKIPEPFHCEQSTQVQINVEFEIDQEINMDRHGEGNQEMSAAFGPIEIEPVNNGGEEVEDAGNVDDESFSWENSIPTNELDFCEVESDLSEIDEMPFDQPEAQYTLYSVLF